MTLIRRPCMFPIATFGAKLEYHDSKHAKLPKWDGLSFFLSLFFIYYLFRHPHIFFMIFPYIYTYISTPPSATPCHIPHATFPKTSHASAGNESHLCLFGPTWAPHVRTPYLVHEEQFDHFLLGNRPPRGEFWDVKSHPRYKKKQMKPVVDVGAYGFTESMGLCNGAVLY